MKYIVPILITGSLLLSACAPTTPTAQHGGNASESGGHQQDVTAGSANLMVRDQSTDNEIAFSVREGNETFADYGVSHTKEMHLIVVRDDLQHFQHLHPERDTDGVWRVSFTAPAGGTYWRYADFVDTDEKTYTIQFDKEFLGDLGTYGIAKNSETVKTVDGYRIELETAKMGNDVSFTYKITDANSQPVQVEQYLGARGHSVLISPTGDFIHAHASEEGEDPVFTTTLPPDSFYRAFTQFQIKGEVITVDFDWQS
jgi:hypothetical protein